MPGVTPSGNRVQDLHSDRSPAGAVHPDLPTAGEPSEARGLATAFGECRSQQVVGGHHPPVWKVVYGPAGRVRRHRQPGVAFAGAVVKVEITAPTVARCGALGSGLTAAGLNEDTLDRTGMTEPHRGLADRAHQAAECEVPAVDRR